MSLRTSWRKAVSPAAGRQDPTIIKAYFPPTPHPKPYLWKVAAGQRTVTESLQGAQAVIGSQVADKAYVHPVRSDVVLCSHAAGKIHSAAHELQKDSVKLDGIAEEKGTKQSASMHEPPGNGGSNV